jgi:esterase
MPAHLHHELVAGAAATRCLALVHGIYGAGANWRSIAKKLVERRPEWAVALIDLRHHGHSLAADPPDTIAACADDLRAAIDAIEVRVTAIAGHSFGGKVALATRRLAPPIDETWVLDASPSAGTRSIDDTSDTVIAVLELMERLPRRWPRRDDFIAAVVEAGQDIALARWLAMNVVADGADYVLRLDLTAIRAMLSDYFAQDLWEAVTAPAPGTVEFVIADRATTVTPADRTRLDTAMPPHVHVHHVDAGHWLHIDAPSTIIDLFAAHL